MGPLLLEGIMHLRLRRYTFCVCLCGDSSIVGQISITYAYGSRTRTFTIICTLAQTCWFTHFFYLSLNFVITSQARAIAE